MEQLCDKISNFCPSGTNSTESEVAPKKEKYMSERPPEVDKGPVHTIVAASWMVRTQSQICSCIPFAIITLYAQDRVINTQQDVLVFQYKGEVPNRYGSPSQHS